jgi:hypothetical protein
VWQERKAGQKFREVMSEEIYYPSLFDSSILVILVVYRLFRGFEPSTPTTDHNVIDACYSHHSQFISLSKPNLTTVDAETSDAVSHAAERFHSEGKSPQICFFRRHYLIVDQLRIDLSSQ